MRFRKTVNLLIVLLFAAAIYVPLLTADFRGGAVSTAENRYLATFPDIVQDGKLHISPRAFDQWINDNVGGRKLSTKLNTRIEYAAFGTSAKSDTLLGKNGWTFYYTESILNDYSGTNLMDEEALSLFVDNLSGIAEYVREQNSEFLTVVAPDKKTVYPEQYSQSIRVVSEKKRTAQILEAVSGTTDIPAYSLENALIARKDIGTLYSPQIDNGHWNRLGAYVGYESILKTLSEMGVEAQWTPLDSCDIEEIEETGLFNEAVPLSEINYSVTGDRTNTYSQDSAHLDQFPYLTFNKNPETYKKYYVHQDQTLPSILFIGDSYTVSLFSYVPQSFSRTMFMHSADLPHLFDVLEQESFDVVVLECAERMLDFEFDLADACLRRIRSGSDMSANKSRIEALAVRECAEGGYLFVDYTGNTPAALDTVYVESASEKTFIEGWARDPLAASFAGSVFVQVGDRYYETDYGKERQSVADYFQSKTYLQSGYTCLLDSDKMLQAGEIKLHVVSADGTYRYPPIPYKVEALP